MQISCEIDSAGGVASLDALCIIFVVDSLLFDWLIVLSGEGEYE
jgi:hypothetical protein